MPYAYTVVDNPVEPEDAYRLIEGTLAAAQPAKEDAIIAGLPELTQLTPRNGCGPACWAWVLQEDSRFLLCLGRSARTAGSKGHWFRFRARKLYLKGRTTWTEFMNSPNE
jgi:hypothetical protein